MTRFTLRIPVGLRDSLQVHADRRETSLNKLVVQLLRKELAWLDKDNPGEVEPRGVRTLRERAVSASALVGRKVGRNASCPCGSGKKAKVCHPELTR